MDEQSDPQRLLLGLPLGLQSLLLTLAVLAIGALIGLAVFSWLERTA